jgi:hypothetical protein
VDFELLLLYNQHPIKTTMETITPQAIVAFLFGIVFIVTLLILALKFPYPTPFQGKVFQIVLSLAAAGVAAMLPGIMNVEFSSSWGGLLRAGGTLSVFVIIYFFNPADFVANKSLSVDGTKISSNKLDDSLKTSLALAVLDAQRRGEAVVGTHNLFAAMRTQDDELAKLINKLPDEALPKPVDKSLVPDRKVLGQPIEFSQCIRDAFKKLAPQATTSRKLKPEDVFADIARYGKGNSVLQLRNCGFDKEKIEGLVKQLSWHLIQRDDSPHTS